jgi:excisionase family DNA binding protein
MTPNELARYLRVSPDSVRSWIKSGRMKALNTASARCAKPRYVILPHHLAEWEQSHSAIEPELAPRARMRRRAEIKDFFPDLPG